ncbi:MAG: 3-keto-5-aminohexanoate cleavage protein, partial [Alphaproteobacteria bacterium]
TREFHPAVPYDAAELARDAALVIAEGASELHIHPRGPDGTESLDPDIVAQALLAIRKAVPGTPIGLSTHWRIPPGERARQKPIEAWRVLPDYVSVNLIEDDAADLIALVLGKGIGVEAGIWSIDDAQRFVALPRAGNCLRVLVEINEQDIDEGLAAARGILAVLQRSELRLPVLLHGDEASVWPMFRQALSDGHDSRIGLEDGNLLPAGGRARDNADLIRAARRLAGA